MGISNVVQILLEVFCILGKVPLAVHLSQSDVAHTSQVGCCVLQNQHVRTGWLRPTCASTSAGCVVDAFKCHQEIDRQGQEVLRLYGCCHSNHLDHWLLLAVLGYRLCRLSASA